jgi:hypothetical protein
LLKSEQELKSIKSPITIPIPIPSPSPSPSPITRNPRKAYKEKRHIRNVRIREIKDKKLSAKNEQLFMSELKLKAIKSKREENEAKIALNEKLLLENTE